MRLAKNGVWLGILPAISVSACLTLAGSWEIYSTDEYGLRMLVPSGARVFEIESPGGWGELYASHDGVELSGYAKLGPAVSAEEIEAFGVEETGIPKDHWTVIDEGTNQQGWEWYRTVTATRGERLLFGGYGVGPKGSYLLVLQTTKADFDAHRSDYNEWYESISLF